MKPDLRIKFDMSANVPLNGPFSRRLKCVC